MDVEMNRVLFSLLYVALCLLGVTCADEIDFNRDIRPILSNNCFQCHGPGAEQREADLRLDQEASAKEHAVVPGDLESELIQRILSMDPDEKMPPADSGKELDQAEIEILKRWVKQGAAWARHWAYEPPRLHEVPKSSSDNSDNWIDAFIEARLLSEGLKSSHTADDVTLVRRLHFDLLGLPPTTQDVQAYLDDSSDTRYKNLVDRLLDSPHFGERMAIYWLDLVRYADTVGYHGDQDQNISPYRDYVIDAFNRNLPFDQFTREQLAGDLLEEPTVDQRVATGYNRMLQTSHEGGVQPKEYLAIYQADRVRNVSAVWMGATLGCAQCHDHKYDPFTAKDFYAMAAFFADIDEEQHFSKGTNDLPTKRPPEIDVLSRLQRERLQQIETEIASLSTDESEASQAVIAELRNEKDALEKQKRRTMVTVALAKPRTVRLFPRGNWLDDSGPVVQAAVPEFMGEIDQRANRLDLANWLVNDRDGAGLLTARVMANRFWYLFFGAGLSESLDDFGGQGKPPQHPQLLDNLAIAFAEDWDVKKFVKRLVMSRTYQQSSDFSEPLLERDPKNLLFARQSRYRLPAEAVRDMALSVSGLLVDDVGGGSIKPYQPFGYYRHLNFPQRRYSHHGDQRQWRRGVYVHWQRQYLHPMLKAFDAPTREECTAQRPRSNTPSAALVLLNDPTFVEAARGLADRLMSTDANDEDRITSAFQIVLSRSPAPSELQPLMSLLAASREQLTDEQAVELLDVGQRHTEPKAPREAAAWTMVARAMLNLSEAMTRR